MLRSFVPITEYIRNWISGLLLDLCQQHGWTIFRQTEGKYFHFIFCMTSWRTMWKHIRLWYNLIQWLSYLSHASVCNHSFISGVQRMIPRLPSDQILRCGKNARLANHFNKVCPFWLQRSLPQRVRGGEKKSSRCGKRSWTRLKF